MNADASIKAHHNRRSAIDPREPLKWVLDSLMQTTDRAAVKSKPQTGSSQSEVVKGLDKLNLERKVRYKAVKIPRDKEAKSQLLA